MRFSFNVCSTSTCEHPTSMSFLAQSSSIAEWFIFTRLRLYSSSSACLTSSRRRERLLVSRLSRGDCCCSQARCARRARSLSNLYASNPATVRICPSRILNAFASPPHCQARKMSEPSSRYRLKDIALAILFHHSSSTCAGRLVPFLFTSSTQASTQFPADASIQSV